MASLTGQVALVAGATRGAGRGIALALAEAGATVYATGRSSRADARSVTRDGAFDLAGRPETIEETVELIEAAGGKGYALKVDHTDEAAVQALVARILAEQGRLDVLVNDIWGGEHLVEWGKPFWELEAGKALAIVETVLRTHLVTARHAAGAMVAAGKGLIVEITDGDGFYFRHNLAYDLAKVMGLRLAFGMAEELRPHGVAAVALTPGFLRSEAMLEHLGVTEATWRDAIAEDEHFAFSETPRFVGRAVAALAGDPELLKRSGKAFSSWGLSREFGFTDLDGTRPDWGAHSAGEAFRADQQASHDRWVSATPDWRA